MRAAVGLLLALLGCESYDGFDVLPGGPGGPGITLGPDAFEGDDDGSDAGDTLVGRVCVVSDLRFLTTGCAVTGADGITVTLGAKTATTNPDGTFEIATPAGSGLVWHASGAAIVTSAVPFSTDFVIPAITADDYRELLLANIALDGLIAGQGSLVVRVVQTGVPAVDAIAASNPPAQFATMYDGNSAQVWDRDETGGRGLVWITGQTIGAATVRVTPVSGSALDTLHVVEDQAITFGSVEIP